MTDDIERRMEEFACVANSAYCFVSVLYIIYCFRHSPWFWLYKMCTSVCAKCKPRVNWNDSLDAHQVGSGSRVRPRLFRDRFEGNEVCSSISSSESLKLRKSIRWTREINGCFTRERDNNHNNNCPKESDRLIRKHTSIETDLETIRII